MASITRESTILRPKNIAPLNHNMSGKSPGLSNDFLPFHLISSGSKPNDSGERLNGIQEVSGSIPLISTKNDKPQGQKCLVVFSYAIIKKIGHLIRFKET